MRVLEVYSHGHGLSVSCVKWPSASKSGPAVSPISRDTLSSLWPLTVLHWSCFEVRFRWTVCLNTMNVKCWSIILSQWENKPLFNRRILGTADSSLADANNKVKLAWKYRSMSMRIVSLWERSLGVVRRDRCLHNRKILISLSLPHQLTAFLTHSRDSSSGSKTALVRCRDSRPKRSGWCKHQNKEHANWIVESGGGEEEDSSGKKHVVWHVCWASFFDKFHEVVAKLLQIHSRALMASTSWKAGTATRIQQPGDDRCELGASMHRNNGPK